ncbi:MAG: DUF4157 domain-containing protein [Bacteroidetes bacterium]|nr:DUF4157 domain-containing protein [Bacteroidota bacterium]
MVMPAVPILQQKPAKDDEPLLQAGAATEVQPLTSFTAPTVQLSVAGAIAPFAPQINDLGQQSRSLSRFSPVQKRENKTGMPDDLKSGIENLSGFDMSDVHVHYNSRKPAQLQALAYAQGSDIHIAPGQDRHLPHEAWHVVQQKQGRVRATRQMREGAQVNDETGLEREADIMGNKAAKAGAEYGNNAGQLITSSHATDAVAQRVVIPIPGHHLTLDIADPQVSELAGPEVGMGEGMRVCNAAFMRFRVTYSLTNDSPLAAERNITIGLIQNGVQDDVFGDYESAGAHAVTQNFGITVLPFLDADDETAPFYSADARRQHAGVEQGEIVEGQVTIDDRPNIAIPHNIESPTSVAYTSTALRGTRGLRIWLRIMEDDAPIYTCPIATWTINLVNGTVAVGAGAGNPVT